MSRFVIERLLWLSAVALPLILIGVAWLPAQRRPAPAPRTSFAIVEVWDGERWLTWKVNEATHSARISDVVYVFEVADSMVLSLSNGVQAKIPRGRYKALDALRVYDVEEAERKIREADEAKQDN